MDKLFEFCKDEQLAQFACAEISPEGLESLTKGEQERLRDATTTS